MELIVHNMSRKLGEYHSFSHMARSSGKAFMAWKTFVVFKNQRKQVRNPEKNLNQQFKAYVSSLERRYYLKRAFKSFKKAHRERDVRQIEDRVRNAANQELETVSMKYQKEITLLQSKLRTSLDELEAINRSKIQMQEQLKQAFMRGLCAMNLEAMNVLKPGEVAQANFDPKINQMADAMSLNLTNIETALSRSGNT